MMEAARTSETLVNFFQTTRRCNPEDSHLRTHRRENLKSYLGQNDSQPQYRSYATHNWRVQHVSNNAIDFLEVPFYANEWQYKLWQRSNNVLWSVMIPRKRWYSTNKMQRHKIKNLCNKLRANGKMYFALVCLNNMTSNCWLFWTDEYQTATQVSLWFLIELLLHKHGVLYWTSKSCLPLVYYVFNACLCRAPEIRWKLMTG
jgi:hypothetical protein